MAAPGYTPSLIVASLIVVLGIIHLGVGAGVVAKYNRYNDIFRQPVGISGYDIVVGIFAIGVGILCVITIALQKVFLCRPALICSFVLGVLSIASLITALILNAQAISFMRSRLLYRMNTYIDIQSSITIVDMVQSNWQCCGVNLWLDYANVGLGTTPTGTGGTGTGTTTGTGTGTTTGGTGRRRRYLDLPSSPLVNAVRQRRQTTSSTGVYGLPTTYTFNLPLSCCQGGSGQQSGGNSLGGFCVFSGGNSTTSFYVQGCLPTVANIAVAQITGIAVINTLLSTLAVVMIPLLIRMFPNHVNAKDPNSKRALRHATEHQQQQQQMQSEGYYSNGDSNAYYGYPQQQLQAPPVYVTSYQ